MSICNSARPVIGPSAAVATAVRCHDNALAIIVNISVQQCLQNRFVRNLNQSQPGLRAQEHPQPLAVTAGTCAKTVYFASLSLSAQRNLACAVAEQSL